MWHKPSWRRSPLAPPQSRWADNPQTAEQLYQGNSHTIKKVLGPQQIFPNLEFSKGTENPQGIWLWRPVGFDYRTSTGLGKPTLGGHKQNLVHTRSQEKEQFSHKRLSQTCLCVPRSLQQRHGSTVAWCGVRSTEYNSACTSPFQGGHQYLHCPYHRLASGQTTRREHSPSHQQKTRLKIYWAWPRPSKQDPVSPTVSLSHQDAFISFLSIRG